MNYDDPRNHLPIKLPLIEQGIYEKKQVGGKRIRPPFKGKLHETGETLSDRTCVSEKAIQHRINIKPLSVNLAWQGKRFKTSEYKVYETAVLFMLPKITIPEPPYRLSFTFGFSNIQSDVDNPVKLLTDILSKKYGFNDKLVHESIAKKVKVKKGDEFIEFSIEGYRE